MRAEDVQQRKTVSICCFFFTGMAIISRLYTICFSITASYILPGQFIHLIRVILTNKSLIPIPVEIFKGLVFVMQT
jgi:hypothetical protein